MLVWVSCAAETKKSEGERHGSCTQEVFLLQCLGSGCLRCEKRGIDGSLSDFSVNLQETDYTFLIRHLKRITQQRN